MVHIVRIIYRTMFKQYFFILLSSCIFALVGCIEHPTYFHGYIDNEFIDFLEQDIEDEATIVLSSNGGKTHLGILTAEVIRKKKIHVMLSGKYGFCLSACAEYVLPSAHSLRFLDNPIIGYHQNAQIINSILNDGATKDMEFCEFLKTQVSGEKKVLERGKLNVDYWKETLVRLELTYSKVHYFENQCPGLMITFKNELWLPTSKQLKDIIGLDVAGTVCADDYLKCSKRVNELWEKGTSIVIGDIAHISTGQSFE